MAEGMTHRAFLTGITGFVGSHLLDYLIENTDWEIHGLLRWRSSLDNIRQHVKRINDKDRIFLHYGDLNDDYSLRKAIRESRPHYVFHLAAQSYPQTSFDSPIDTLNTNILGTCRLLSLLKPLHPGPKIHICSSSEVFGRVTPDKLPISEDCVFHPASPYSISKIGTDYLGGYYAEAYNMDVRVTRMFTHTGPRRGDVFVESTFAKQIAMIEAGLQEPVVKTGNLNSMRTWADVRDAVRAYYILLTVNPIADTVYNIGGDFSCSVGDMLNKLIEISGVKCSIEIDPSRLRPLDADLQIPDTSKFRRHTGWKPEIPFEQTMHDLLDYWRERVRREGAFLQR